MSQLLRRVGCACGWGDLGVEDAGCLGVCGFLHVGQQRRAGGGCEGRGEGTGEGCSAARDGGGGGHAHTVRLLYWVRLRLCAWLLSSEYSQVRLEWRGSRVEKGRRRALGGCCCTRRGRSEEQQHLVD